MTNFWKHATAEQKLAQIKGAIELGMSGSQCAMNCGANRRTLHAFALKHGVPFPRDGAEAVRKQSDEARLFVLKKATAERFKRDLADDDSAYLFDDRQEFNLFEPHPNDERAFA